VGDQVQNLMNMLAIRQGKRLAERQQRAAEAGLPGGATASPSVIYDY